MARRILISPGLGDRQKCIALCKHPLNPGIFRAALGVREIKPLRTDLFVCQGDAQAFTVGGRKLGQHAHPKGFCQGVVFDHPEPRLALRRTSIGQLITVPLELPTPSNRDRLLIARGDRDSGVEEGRTNHAPKRRLSGNDDFKMAHLLGVEYTGRNWHHLGLAGLQHVLTRPHARCSHQTQDRPEPPTTSSHCAPIPMKNIHLEVSAAKSLT